MQANGGIADPEMVRERAVTTTLRGRPPASSALGRPSTTPTSRLVTFDMGGTSSDVSLVRDGRAERTTDAEIDGLPIRTPMVDVNTVGAGGGSVAWVDGGRSGSVRVRRRRSRPRLLRSGNRADRHRRRRRARLHRSRHRAGRGTDARRRRRPRRARGDWRTTGLEDGLEAARGSTAWRTRR